jgi:osmotically inducible protein OsmC
VRYTAKTHTFGGRRGGVSRSDDGRLDVKFSAPGFPGTGTKSGAAVYRWLVGLFH